MRGLIACIALMLATAMPAHAQQEDVLSAKDEGVSELLADGYEVVEYELVAEDESRLILRKRYNVVLCKLEEGSGDDDALEVESVCYRLR